MASFFGSIQIKQGFRYINGSKYNIHITVPISVDTPKIRKGSLVFVVPSTLIYESLVVGGGVYLYIFLLIIII